MTLDELEVKLIELMSFPMKGKIQINVDYDKKIFTLSLPIFRCGQRKIPLSVETYVSHLQGKYFRPFAFGRAQGGKFFRPMTNDPWSHGQRFDVIN